MKKAKLLLTALLLASFTALAAGCADNDREDYLEDKVEQLEQQVTDLEKKNAGEGTSKDAGGNTADTNDTSQKDAGSYDTLKASVDDITARISAAAPAGSASEQRDQYHSLKKELDDIDHQLDLYDDSLEEQYYSGTLNDADYREQERQVDSLEDSLDHAEDELERLFGIDD